jgi:hypothetical protein
MKVLVMSGTTELELLRDVRVLRPDALLPKPVDVDKLLQHLDPPDSD